jgi:hypothetical protein
MTGDKPLFSELNGFVIYEPELLKKYLENNNLKNNNLLQYFTKTEHGDIITENGIVIPMMDIDDDYYNFSIIENINEKIVVDKKFSSKGWIMQIISNEIHIIGIGYFYDIQATNENNILKFNVENGWYEIEITGGTIGDKLFYELILNKKENKPEYYGDINFSYKL